MTDGAFAGRVALVTGGASGIGAAAVARFARGGAAVVVADRSSEGEELVDRLRADGHDAAFVKVDVTVEADVARMVEECVEQFGRLDCAFNNAGITGPPAPLHETTLDVWRQVIDTDLTSVFLCMRAELAHMLRHGGGAIVNTSSQTSVSPAAGLVSYSAAKQGVVGLTLSGAVEYAAHGVRVNAILPGATDTPMIRNFGADHADSTTRIRTDPSGYATPDQQAALAVWLCSDDAAWVSGQCILADRAKALHLSAGSPPAWS